MSNYTYRISASGTASGADAGFTTLNAAVADCVGNDRTGGGANGRIAASSTVYFKIDGYLSLGAGDVYGIDTTTNSNAAVVVEAWANPWNAAERALGYTTSFDGVNFGSGAQMVAGAGGSRQAKLTVRNLVLTNSLGTYGVIDANGPSDASSNVLIENCVLLNSAASNAKVARLDAADMKNCLGLTTAGTSNQFLDNYGHACKIDQCTFVALAGSSTLINNQNDPLPIFRNCYVGGFTAFSSVSSFSGSCVGNATDQASGWTGTTGTLYSVALSTTNFQNVTGGTEDFRAKVTSVLKTTGATRLSTALTDVFASSRSNPATIGAYEAAAADTTAPTLTSPTGAATGISTASGSVSTDEGNGTLYAVVTTSATPPSVAQIQAGQDNSSAAAAFDTSQAVSGTGSQSISGGATGLAPGTTYYWHFQHRDAAANNSTVVSSASFTTDALGTITLLAMRNQSGTLLTSHTVHVNIIDAVTLAHVLTLLSQTTDGTTGVLALSNAAIEAGTDYAVTTVDPSAVASDPCGARVYTAT